LILQIYFSSSVVAVTAAGVASRERLMLSSGARSAVRAAVSTTNDGRLLVLFC